MQLPPDFVSRTRALLGDGYPLLEEALRGEAPVSVRMNRRKWDGRHPAERVAWCETGYYLPERIPFTFDPLFHAGAYYVQEASSMFLEQAVKAYIREPVRCLDLCAAPGGKSTHLLDVLPEGSLLVSNEVIRSRSYVLSENTTKWGNPFTVVTNNDPAEIGQSGAAFDVIVADVPCSGEGMFRKDPGSLQEWSVPNVLLCAERQRRIIRDVWPALKEGGLLIYSTCTYNADEDEGNIRFITDGLGAEALEIPVRDEWQITGALKDSLPVCRFFPHQTKGEGFFLAVLRKTGGGEPSQARKPAKQKAAKKTLPVPSGINPWLSHPDQFHIEVSDTSVRAFPPAHLDFYRLLDQRLRILSAGIHLAEQKGKDLIPQHSLAMSTQLNRDAFAMAELRWDDAIKYLRKETFPLSTSIPKGYVLLTYQNLPLGFAKQLGNRINNLYPQEWRIRTSYTPERPERGLGGEVKAPPFT